ncbi:MAG TPA: Crp/Fnr family transcriptional regulator [Caulobacteraceae bacterium]
MAAGGDLAAFVRPIFACSAEVAGAICARAADRRYPAREMILRQGDRSGETFLLVDGRAQGLLYGAEGQLVLLQEFAPGDVFGAIAQHESEPHPADVTAVEDSRAAVFGALDFVGLIETYGCVALMVTRTLLKQLRAATGRIAERSTLSAVGRIHAELLRLAGAGQTIRPAPVLAALAVRVNTTRETVSRTINALERRGVIRREADTLIVLARGRLEEI